jgi:F-type H+-transporting ATPase subunit gamma
VSGATESLGRKIAGARDLKAVVRTMKGLAASSIGRYENAVEALDEYYRTVELGLMACLKMETAIFPATTAGPAAAEAIVAIVFGSDQGLVGRFNDVLMEFAMGTLKSLPGKTQQIWPVGERMHALTVEAGLPVSGLMLVPNSVEAIAPLVGQILITIEQTRERSGIREVYVFHNHQKSAAVYEPVGKRLLPLDALWRSEIAGLPWPTKNLPQVIEGAAPALEAFVREYLFVLLFQACAESLASENASRLAAMQRAEKNIDGILEDLNRTFHRVRQESIDEELFELISGYEALAQRR